MTTLLNSKADELNPTQYFASGFAIAGGYTTAEIAALSNVVEGSIVLDTTTNKLNAYLNGAWEAITSV